MSRTSTGYGYISCYDCDYRPVVSGDICCHIDDGQRYLVAGVTSHYVFVKRLSADGDLSRYDRELFRDCFLLDR